MGKKLYRTVVVDGVVYPAGSELPDGVEVKNERAFEEPEVLSPAEQIQAAEDRLVAEQEERAKAAEDAEKSDAPAKPASRGTARK